MSGELSLKKNYRRSYTNLQKKFFEYLIPAAITGIASSLNEMADSLVVSNLLDSRSLSVVNLGSTFAFVVATIYIILGFGGSEIYTMFLGNHEKKRADKTFTVSMFSTTVMCIVIAVPMMLFSNQIASFLARGSGLEQEFLPYMRAKIISGIPMLLTLTFSYFLTCSGHPVITTVITIVANVLNLIFDIIFIGFMKLGVIGAAWASFTGYIVAAVTAVILMATGRVNLKFEKITAEDLKGLKAIITTGAPSATIQIGYAIKTAFCNLVAANYAGYIGIVAFSLCLQTLSIISISIGGILDAIIPLMCALKGLKDIKGERYLIKSASKIQAVFSIVFVTLLEFKPEIMMTLYSVTDVGANEIIIPAIRIFSLMQLIRWIYVFFMNMCTIRGKKLYAFLISLADGFVFVVILTLLLTPVLGINGMWWAFPMSSAAILLIIYTVNKHIVKKTNHALKGFWLTPKEENIIADITVYDKLERISDISSSIEITCKENGMDSSDAMITAIAIEEMCVITLDQNEKDETVPVDVLIRKFDNDYVIDVRSCGKPFSPVNGNQNESFSSLQTLKKISKSLKYDYVLGLNTTRIKI